MRDHPCRYPGRVTSDQRAGLPPLPESMLPRDHALYRPRHSGRQRPALVAAGVYFLLPLLLLAVGVRPGEFENRQLAEFPSVTDGWDFFTGLSDWADDHIPLREQAVAAADGISRGVFGEPAPLRGPSTGTGPIPEVPSKDPSADRPTPTGHVRVLEGKDDWLYLGLDVEGACDPDFLLGDTLGKLKSLRAAVESSGRRFVLVVPPNKSTAMPEKLPSKYYGADCAAKARDDLWKRLPETGAIDLRSALADEAKRLQAPVYLQRDSHWNHAGAMVMVRRVAEEVQPGVTGSWKVEPAEESKVAADLPTLLGYPEEITLTSYDVLADGKKKAGEPLKGPWDQPKTTTKARGTGIANATALLIGDSFSEQAAPYLSGVFTRFTYQNAATIQADPAATARLMVQNDVVVVEMVERNVVIGASSLLAEGTLNEIKAQLAANPKR